MKKLRNDSRKNQHSHMVDIHKAKLQLPTIPIHPGHILRANIRTHDDIADMAKQETKIKMLESPDNNLKFYNIPSEGIAIDKKTNKRFVLHKYRSIHRSEDATALKSQQIKAAKTGMNFFEAQSREELKKEIVGGNYLLSEIYDAFNEDQPSGALTTLNRPAPPKEIKKVYHQQMEEEVEVENLDGWMKQKLPGKLPPRGMSTNVFALVSPRGPKEDPYGSSQTKNLAGFINPQKRLMDMDPNSKGMIEKMRKIKQTLTKYNLNNQDWRKTMGTPITSATGVNWNSKKSIECYYDSLPSVETLRNNYYAGSNKTMKSSGSSLIHLNSSTPAKTLYLGSTETHDFSPFLDNFDEHSIMNSAEIAKDQVMQETAQCLLQNKMLERNITLKERARISEQDSLLVENQMSKKIRDIESYINNKKTILKTLRSENSTILHKIRNIQNLQKILSTRLSEAKGTRAKQTVALKQAGKSNLESLTSSFIALEESEKNLLRLRQDYDSLTENLQSFQQKMEYNSNLINQFEEELGLCKKDLKVAVKTKVKWLLNLLKNGIDSRENGLSWIVRTLWNLGEKVYHDQCPNFLDTDARQFLIKKSTLEQEMNEIQTIYNICFEIYKANMDYYKKPAYLLLEDENRAESNVIQEHAPNSSLNAERLIHTEPSHMDDHFRNRILSTHQNIIHEEPEENAILQGEFLEGPAIQQTGLSFSHVMTEPAQIPSQTTEGFFLANRFNARRFGSGSEINGPLTLRSEGSYEGIDHIEEGSVQTIPKTTMDSFFKPPWGFQPSHQTLNDRYYNKAKSLIRRYLHPEKTVTRSASRASPTVGIPRPEDMDSDGEIKLPVEIQKNIQELSEHPTETDEEKQGDDHLVLYDQDIMINKFNNRAEFLNEMRTMKQRLMKIQQELKENDTLEIMRLFREFTAKGYGNRFKIDIGTVLCALFGAKKAEKELAHNGKALTSIIPSNGGMDYPRLIFK